MHHQPQTLEQAEKLSNRLPLFKITHTVLSPVFSQTLYNVCVTPCCYIVLTSDIISSKGLKSGKANNSVVEIMEQY